MVATPYVVLLITTYGIDRHNKKKKTEKGFSLIFKALPHQHNRNTGEILCSQLQNNFFNAKEIKKFMQKSKENFSNEIMNLFSCHAYVYWSLTWARPRMKSRINHPKHHAAWVIHAAAVSRSANHHSSHLSTNNVPMDYVT